MLKKVYEINKKTLEKTSFFLFYGENEGSKREKILEILANINKENIQKYDEKEILENEKKFFENILSKSLFEDKKFIIVKRATDKIVKIISEILDRDIQDITIIIDANLLDKKSKLRSLFEKEKNLICVPFYKDTEQVLSDFTKNFLRENNISLSQSDINFIVIRCNGDRGILINELTKIKLFAVKNKKVKTEDILRLTNLIENYSINELIDNCLAQNYSKTVKILNENNFASEEGVIIIKTFLSKAKKILNLSIDYQSNKDLELTLKNSRPPIFWKDKEITKKMLIKWQPNNIKQLIYKLSNTELQIKKNFSNSINLITNFIYEQLNSKANN